MQSGHDLKVMGNLLNLNRISWSDTADNRNGVTLFKRIQHPLNPLEMVSSNINTRPANQSIPNYFLLSYEIRHSLQALLCEIMLSLYV